MAAHRSPARRWIARLIVLGFATAFALILAEIGARIHWRRDAILFPRYHTHATYGDYRIRRLRPNTTFYHTSADGRWAFTTNAQGYRDTRDWQHARTPGVGRVLVLGDSHTEGFECRQDHTYAAILEKRLRALGEPTEVFNCGVSGFGTAEELAFLENEGLKYQPDAVVVGWFENDLSDNVNAGLFALREGQLGEVKREHLPGINVLNQINRWSVMRGLSENSYFYSLLFNRVYEWRKRLQSQQSGAVPAAPTSERTMNAGPDIPKDQEDLAAALLVRMQKTCEKAGVRLVVVDIPSWRGIDNFANSMPPRVLEAVRANGVEVLTSADLLEPYRGVTEIFVAHGQHHISEPAHLQIGMKLAEVLRKKR
jgi:hypothetical protein